MATLNRIATAARRYIRAYLHHRKLVNGHCSMTVIVHKHKPFAYRLESRKIAMA